MVESETVNIRNEEHVHMDGRNTGGFTSIVKFQLLPMDTKYGRKRRRSASEAARTINH